MRSLVCAVAAAVTGACASPEDLGAETAFLVPPGQEDPCPPDGCGGGNSPVVSGVYFWRLDIADVPGLPNPEGVRITSVKRDMVSMPLRLKVVNGDRLQVVSSGVVIADGAMVVGTRIEVDVDGSTYAIRIASAGQTAHFWVKHPVPIWEYELRYRPVSGPAADKCKDRELCPERALCSEGDGDPTKVSAIVFGGDLYNPETKAVAEGPETAGWMNIACADSAPYKMYRIGYTSAAKNRIGLATTLAQRQAMMNAWTSNLCGDGTSHTKQGEPILMRESLDVQNFTSPYRGAMASYEAIWSEHGAVCLDRHRLDDEQVNNQADEEETDLDIEITDTLRTACMPEEPLPTCTEMMMNGWTAYGHVLIGNP
jgi:hypothetical protein